MALRLTRGVCCLFCFRAIATAAASDGSQTSIDTGVFLQLGGQTKRANQLELSRFDAVPSSQKITPSDMQTAAQGRNLRPAQFSETEDDRPWWSANFGRWQAWASRKQSAQESPRASHEYCQAALRDKRHVFHGMWSHQGIIDMERFTLNTGPNTQRCWEGMRMSLAQYLRAVRNQSVLSHTCVRNWRAPQPTKTFSEPTSMILGNNQDILAACGGNGNCQEFNMHMLFLLHPWGSLHWNMCRNFEFISCGAMGGLQAQDGGLVFLATAPKDIKVREVTAEAQKAWSENKEEYHGSLVITLFEVCLLDQICSNYKELFGLEKGEFFKCAFDEKRFFELATIL